MALPDKLYFPLSVTKKNQVGTIGKNITDGLSYLNKPYPRTIELVGWIQYLLDNDLIDTSTGVNFTVGSVPFANAAGNLAVDNPNLFWNNTTKRLGLGSALPQSLLDIQGPVGTGAASAGILTLATKELTIISGDQLGRINFNSPLATPGGDAILSGAAIWAEAAATFSATVNNTDLVFGTATTSVAIERMRLASAGTLLLPNYTAGSIPFFGAAGLISEDNANFFWNAATPHLSILDNTATILPVTANNAETASYFYMGDGGGFDLFTIASPGNASYSAFYNNTAYSAEIFSYTTNSWARPQMNFFAGRGTNQARVASNVGDLGMTISSAHYGTTYNDSTLTLIGVLTDATPYYQKLIISTTPGADNGIFEAWEKDGRIVHNNYGVGGMDAITLSKTRSIYLSGYATDGTLIEIDAYGDYTNDGTAAAGAVPVGGVYFNTTNSALHTRMT